MSTAITGAPGYKQKEQLYRLIISQLFYDGHQQLAVGLSTLVQAHPACPPSDKLSRVVAIGLDMDEDQKMKRIAEPVAPGQGIDLEFETESDIMAPEAVLYETCYVTAHKSACRCAAYSADGRLIATGSEDTSIKILDVERMLAKSATPAEIIAQETAQQSMENHPVIRTLYDHMEEVTTLDFHPTEQVLVSGGKDKYIKLFDYSKPSVKRAFKTIQEAEEVRVVAFHPSGDFILCGTAHPTLRLYDVNTAQCYVGAVPSHQHKGPITDLQYSPDAKMYVSASKDGDIKLWDGVSNKCVNSFIKSHDGSEVCSVKFSRNGKYILSAGKDSLVKLWELSTSRCLIAYTGAGATGKMTQRVNAVFNHTEDYVFFPDEKTVSLCCWNSRNAERQRLLALGHNGSVRTIVHSPTGPAFITCSEDYRARFWYRKATD